MKTVVIACLAFVLFAMSVYADTPVIGFITQDTTWTNANSPYTALGNVIVEEGVVLTIEPGVLVNFTSNYSLKIEGALIARGNENAKIVFTSEEQSKGAWQGLIFEDSNVDAEFDKNGNYIRGSILQHCIIEFAEKGVKGNSASPFVVSCIIKNNRDLGIYILVADLDIETVVKDSAVTMNEGGGIYIAGNTVFLTGNTIEGNISHVTDIFFPRVAEYGHTGGVSIWETNEAVFRDNVIVENVNEGNGGGIRIEKCNIVNITNNKIERNSSEHDGGGVSIDVSDSVQINGNTFRGNKVRDGSRGGGVSLSLNETASVNVKGNTFADNEAIGYSSVMGGYAGDACGGGLYIKGGESNIDNNVFSGNILLGGTAGTIGGAFGGGLYIYGLVATISNNTFTQNTLKGGWRGTGPAYGGGLYITCDLRSPALPSDITISNNAFNKNTKWAAYTKYVTSLISGNTFAEGEDGIRAVDAGSTQIIGNKITGNSGEWMIAYGGSGLIFGNAIDNNECLSSVVWIQGSSTKFDRNSVSNNATDWNLIYYEGQGSPNLDATNNYWGSTNEAEIRGKIWDFFHNEEVALVDVVPFLTEAPPVTTVVPDIPSEVDYSLVGAEGDRGGVLIPSSLFPEGQNKVIPLYVPSWANGSNSVQEDNNWKTVKEIKQRDISFESQELPVHIFFPRVNQGDREGVREGSPFSVIAGLIEAYEKSIYVSECKILIQADSGNNFRAVIEVGDPDQRTFFSKYAGQGWIAPLESAFWTVRALFSREIAESFNLEADDFPDQYYTATVRVSAAHKSDSYIGYLSLSSEGALVITPKVYAEDCFRILRVHEFIIPYRKETVKEITGNEFINLLEGPAELGFIKMLTPFLTSGSAVVVQGRSPIEVRVYDSQERVTGVMNGEVREDIPNSVCDREHKIVMILSPSDLYHYEVVGTEEGKYGLDVVSVLEGNTSAFFSVDIPISAKAVHHYSVYWNLLSSGGDGVVMRVDADGDGELESEVIADSDLTYSEYITAINVTPQDKSITTWGRVKDTKLFQNYPNPFNPETWIPYQLAEESKVRIWIYGAGGNLVRQLNLGRKPAGFYFSKEQAAYWNGCDDIGEEVASGVYFYTLQADEFTEIKKMIIIR